MDKLHVYLGGRPDLGSFLAMVEAREAFSDDDYEAASKSINSLSESVFTHSDYNDPNDPHEYTLGPMGQRTAMALVYLAALGGFMMNHTNFEELISSGVFNDDNRPNDSTA